MTRDALDGIAIIGMAGRFPQAPNLQRFWENLRQGIEATSFFSDQELEQAGIPPELLRHPNYVKARGVLEDADLFDAGFFGYSPREAELTDPQIRLFLECAWEVAGIRGMEPGEIFRDDRCLCRNVIQLLYMATCGRRYGCGLSERFSHPHGWRREGPSGNDHLVPP